MNNHKQTAFVDVRRHCLPLWSLSQKTIAPLCEQKNDGKKHTHKRISIVTSSNGAEGVERLAACNRKEGDALDPPPPPPARANQFTIFSAPPRGGRGEKDDGRRGKRQKKHDNASKARKIRGKQCEKPDYTRTKRTAEIPPPPLSPPARRFCLFIHSDENSARKLIYAVAYRRDAISETPRIALK